VLGEAFEIHCRGIAGQPELSQERAVDDEIRVAPDRLGLDLWQ
jgi:hypothetical protein